MTLTKSAVMLQGGIADPYSRLWGKLGPGLCVSPAAQKQRIILACQPQSFHPQLHCLQVQSTRTPGQPWSGLHIMHWFSVLQLGLVCLVIQLGKPGQMMLTASGLLGVVYPA